MSDWSAQELDADFGDARLGKRLVKVVDTLSKHPTQSITGACQTWGEAQATYRFFSNPSVTPQKIIDAHRDACIARMRGESVVLSVQDTSEFNQSTHRATRGLGYVGGPKQLGMMMHHAIAVSPDGVMLGVLDEHVWSRPLADRGKAAARHTRPIEEKESQRWINALQASEAAVPEDVPMVTVTDREGDIFALFAHKRRAGHDLLIRIVHNRALADGTHIHDTIAAAPSLGEHTVEVHARPDRPARTARLSVRVGTMSICSPRSQAIAPVVAATIILAHEDHAPQGQTSIHWMLLTTLDVQTLEDAVRCITWYSRRWVIERFHFTLKSGCKIESLQLETALALQRALAVYAIVAWRILWITHHARRAPDTPCTVAFAPHEWKALYCAHHRTAVLPPRVPSLGHAVRWLAQLGGFLGRRGDGEPGVKVLWQGLQSLEPAAMMYQQLTGDGKNETICV